MIRLLTLVLLFLLSLLTVFKAPAYPFWLIAILVSEYCWLFILITLFVLIAGFWMMHHKAAGNIIGCLASLLFLSPVIRAYQVSARVAEDLDKAFGVKNTTTYKPFSWTRMFRKPLKVQYSTYTYETYSGSFAGSTACTLDYYKAQQQGKRPCIVVIHGGSWSSGDSQQLPELNSYLSKVGYNVASINYRLAPAFKSPAPVEDTRHAISYLKSNADRLNIDTTQFILLGRSAGGQIALLTAYTAHVKSIRGVIDFYGPADMVWGYSVPANPLIFNSRLIMEKYLGGSYSQMPEKYSASSPIKYVNEQTVPTLIIHGHNDVLVAYEHSVRLNIKLQQYGIKHYLLTLPWATHGFDYDLNGPGGQLSTFATLQFIKAITH